MIDVPATPSVLMRAEKGGRFADWRLAGQSILGFWLFYLMTVVLRGLLGPEAAFDMRARLVNGLCGIVLSVLVYGAMRLFARDANVRRTVLVGAAAAIPAAMIMAAVTLKMTALLASHSPPETITSQEGTAIVYRGNKVSITQANGNQLEVNLPPIEQMLRKDLPRILADATVTWYFLFATWVALFIAITEQNRKRDAELRLVEAEAAAHSAHLRALRYQVNPHFLFNTLNSLSSLVMTGRASQAEDMLMALSRFFRTSLSLDPSADVSLAEEIALQSQYLDIERVRFPERLVVEIDVPETLAEARVPALILQPIIENAIKYGVSATRDRVRLSIVARPLDGGRMQLDVTNRVDGADPGAVAAPAHQGTGVGLNNVCQRLDAHFGGAADCRFGPIPGGYRVSIAVPIGEEDE